MTQKHASLHEGRCPVCGVALQIRAGAMGPEVSYDFPRWDRSCRNPAFGSPSMCLAQAASQMTAAVDPTPRGLDDPAEDYVFAKAPF